MHRVCGNPDFSRSPIFVSIRARIRIRGYNYYTSSFLPSDSKLPLHLSFLPQLQRRDDVVVVVVVVRWPDFAVRSTCLRRNWKYVAITVKLEFSLRCGSIAISKISPPTKGSFASIPHTHVHVHIHPSLLVTVYWKFRVCIFSGYWSTVSSFFFLIFADIIRLPFYTFCTLFCDVFFFFFFGENFRKKGYVV